MITWSPEDNTRKMQKRYRRECKRGEIERLWARHGFRCVYCRASVAVESRTVDHFIPRARGGRDNPCNKVPACRECNKRKGDMLPLDFVLWRLRKAERKGHNR